jgi:hypothetical protein
MTGSANTGAWHDGLLHRHLGLQARDLAAELDASHPKRFPIIDCRITRKADFLSTARRSLIGKRRVRFRKSGFSTYITGTPWSEGFMRQYAAALDGVKAQATTIGAERTKPGSVNALIAAYLDCSPASTSQFKTAADETQRTRRNILENFRNAHGDLPYIRLSERGASCC